MLIRFGQLTSTNVQLGSQWLGLIGRLDEKGHLPHVFKGTPIETINLGVAETVN